MLVSGAVEGPVDAAVLRRILTVTGHKADVVHIKHGKTSLLKKVDGYNAAAQLGPWLVLVDLNGDRSCAPPFVATHLPEPASQMLFRVAVRQVEAWLLADRQRLARFLRVGASRIPLDPEELPDAKEAMVNVARQSSNRALREEMVPRTRSGRRTGPAYVARMTEFIDGAWDPDDAAEHAESLSRCLARLRAS